ncbi:5'-methylthioadenosine/S-adenosylhomocysteine nucleosidase family protein [Amycolatopsis lexingtonensis]|uniref:5'-methylthioadenosine/S-adenosylhomocysteine nucleosidase family protein n=1 Tax=Amycolatopsis lexingtonensis TaxID=218822 RepID=UPI003F6E8953
MIVVLTALEVERSAVLDRMTGATVRAHRAGTLFHVGQLGRRRVALGLVGAGNAPAAAIAERAVAEFSPAAMVFVGVAGGLRDWTRLGDVVVATRVYAYHGGRSTDDGMRSSPQAWTPAHRLLELARSVGRAGDWCAAVPAGGRPGVHFEPVASGEVVLDSRTSEVARWLHEHYTDAVAVEMESAGFALAGHLNDDLPAISVRGVSDHAGGAKEVTDGAGWQPVAAGNAAAFAEALIAEIDDEDADTPAGPSEEPRGFSNQNVANDHARVGQQIGAVYGNLTVGPQRGDRK